MLSASKYATRLRHLTACSITGPLALDMTGRCSGKLPIVIIILKSFPAFVPRDDKEEVPPKSFMKIAAEIPK